MLFCSCSRCYRRYEGNISRCGIHSERPSISTYVDTASQRHETALTARRISVCCASIIPVGRDDYTLTLAQFVGNPQDRRLRHSLVSGEHCCLILPFTEEEGSPSATQGSAFILTVTRHAQIIPCSSITCQRRESAPSASMPLHAAKPTSALQSP